MNTSRRSFVLNAGSVIAAAIVAPGALNTVFGQAMRGGFVPPVESTLDPFVYLTSDHFRPFIGTSTTARSISGRRATFRLVEVNDTQLEQNEKRGYRGPSYSLVLESTMRGPGEMYEFNHKLLGTFSLFVSPVGRRGNRFEAVVNRISQSDQG